MKSLGSPEYPGRPIEQYFISVFPVVGSVLQFRLCKTICEPDLCYFYEYKTGYLLFLKSKACYVQM